MGYTAERLANFGTTIFAEMTALAEQHEAINLGQGFPDFPAPKFIKEAAVEAIKRDINQYAPGRGRLRLREAIAARSSRLYNLSFDPETDITVTCGATEAIFAAVVGLVDPGDEVILFEPYYDSYVPSIKIAGGVPRFYTLRPPDWTIDARELADLFSIRTKLLLLNTPHNPIGKVYSRQELEMIADLCQEHDVIAVVDEVYEHIVFDGERHLPLASLPGMAGRTVTISSTGKTFSVTGWKVGWAAASEELNQAVFRGHQYITYSGAAPLQEAAAVAMENADNYYRVLAAMYQSRRDFLTGVLQAAGLKPITPRGTYFVMADIGHLGFKDDVAFCYFLTTEIGVAAIPPSAFYRNPADGSSLVRFAFCKEQETLERAAERLMRLSTLG